MLDVTLKCPSTDDRIHTHTEEGYSAKRNTMLPIAATGGGGERCTKGSILDGKDKKSDITHMS